MAIVSNLSTLRKMPQVFCRKKEKEKERGGPNNYPYKVIDITPPPKHLGIRCFPSSSESSCGGLVGDPTAGIESLIQKHKSINLQCGESVTIEGQTYTISSVTHRYQLRKGKYEPSEKRLDVLSTGRYILNLYLESLLEKS